LSFPSGLDIGPAGIVYVADSGNNRVQGFDLLGNWQIAWGRDVNATDPSSVFELCTAASGDTCQAGAVGSQAGEMFNPSGIATDGTEAVYVADTNNHRIQKFSFTGIVTWGSAGTAGGEFSNPFGIGSDADGTVYVGDTANNRVQMFGANAGPLPPLADVTPIPAPVAGATPPFTAPTGLRAAARQKCKRKHRTRAGGDRSRHHKKLRKCRRKANRLPV
jgi:sugar lactone lactonase YvrE